MPSKIFDIAEKLGQIIETVLPEYKRLPNPYDVNANTFLQLRRGYGIEVGEGTNTQRYVGCLTTWQRTYNITLVRKVTTTDNNVDARIAVEQGILDDHEELLKTFEVDVSMDGLVIKAVVGGDGGINFLDVDRQKFLAMTIGLDIEYQFNPKD